MTAEEMARKVRKQLKDDVWREKMLVTTARPGWDALLALCKLALATQAYGKTECDEHEGEWCPEIEAAWGRVSDAIGRLVELGLLQGDE